MGEHITDQIPVRQVSESRDGPGCYSLLWDGGEAGFLVKGGHEIVSFNSSQEQCPMRYKLGLTQSPGWGDCPRWDEQSGQKVGLVWLGPVGSEQLVLQ